MPGRISPNEPIAIVGSACRFAGDANSPSRLWELLKEPRDVRREIPGSRFSAQGFHHPDHSHHGRSNVMHSYLLDEDPKAFDAEFFGINPIEARAMDPQQRLLMETVYEALESGGMTIGSLRGSDTSVFAGVMCGDYEAMLLRDLDQVPTYFAVGTSRAVLSNRISYFFDWHGASVTTDTACSSSLVAVHSAIQTLRAGDSRMAVACGSNIILGPEMYIIESKLKMLSPDGLGRMWDKDANGYARGDGVAAITLKTLSAALEDNDHIECIIRETGLNQDGATAGLTMPSASAQKALIQATYAKAGLDINSPAGRPQYFEAHGTGTPAGDPVEAEAVSRAFFDGKHSDGKPETGKDRLYVGSIKTVLGHTEGTAGVAAILKASLALQNSCIPPNLLFDNINPSVAPFYGDLQIVKSARPWPAVSGGSPRRASVNSFGFGGANAHAILESYDSLTNDDSRGHVAADRTLFTPLVFSAASADSLRRNLAAYATYLDAHSEVDISDLAYTLRERRSTLPHRVSFPSTGSPRELANAIRMKLEDGDKTIGVRTLPGRHAGTPKMLGIFTGQGSQYARQGAELLEHSPFARRIIQKLEADLAQLPADDRPAWSLEAEILAGASTPSRINEAAISQPLCTAIQILMVELLREAKVRLDAVVGHSSGEIAAAYSAGFLTARDAMYVAYYRGLHCRHAASPNGKMKGAMLAVGTSMEDALQLCEDEEFAGRINLAASNSSSSVTISGDEDAIEELEFILADEKKFHRRLRVDMAYHSQHMEPCSEPYIDSLRRAGVRARTPEPCSSPCAWYSSVDNGKPIELSRELRDTYWAENMTKPVLFSQALKAALTANAVSAFDAVLEIGPHPALKGPASQTIQELSQDGLPYHGTLSRGSNALGAFTACLGFLWERLGGDCSRLDLGRCERTLSDSPKVSRFNVLKGLPTYQWKHDTPYWHESRRSRRIRSRKEPFHPLLGDKSPDSAAHVLRWKNILKPSNIPWLEGHQVQGQIVFPASAYLSTAAEAALSLADKRTIKLIEMSNFTIHQGLGFGSRDAGIEVQIELTRISQLKQDHLTAYFTYSAATGGSEPSELTLIADGELNIRLGDGSLGLLPTRRPTAPHLLTVDPIRLYNFMESLEYNFSGPFLSLVELRRKLGIASCVAKRAKASSLPDADLLLIHPVELDAAIQSVSLAYSYPGDEQLRLLHMPTTIAKIRINPAVMALQHKQGAADYANTVDIDSTCNRDRKAQPGSGFSGNFNIYANGWPNAAIQVDQVKFQPVRSSASDDRNVFYKMQYVPCEPDGTLAAANIPITKADTDLLWAFSRIVCYFLREFDRVPEDSPIRSDSTLKHYLRYARHMTELLKNGGHRYGKAEWPDDKLEDIMAEVESKGLAENPVVKIMLLVGNTMPKVFRGETTMLEHFRTSGLLDEYYAKGFGTAQSTMWLSNIVKQITDRRPHLNLLEIGAGTGGATKQILRTIDRSFDTYTFTDISSSFFENAAENLSQWRDRMVFKVCDAEQNPLDQGFIEGQYDVVIAFLVVHATAKLDETMRNIRKLLKPGGFLLIGEGNSEGPMQAGASYIFGPLPGWWRGVDEGRTLTPFINVEEWEVILKRTGFSGIDTISPQQVLDTFGTILFVSQATDEHIESIRAPLKSSPIESFAEKTLAIVGGKTPEVDIVAKQLDEILRPSFKKTQIYTTLEDLEHIVLDDELSIISLTEFEQPVFKDITPERWSGFRKLFVGEKTVLWLTSGRLEDEPYSNMTVGFGRSAMHEEEDLVLQMLDIPDRKHLDARNLAETFVRLAATHPSDKEILYTTEPEVVTDKEGRQLVPRLCSIQGANDRLNSIQRLIVHQVDAKTTEFELQWDPDSYSIRQVSRFEALNSAERSRTIELRTTKAILSAIRTPAGHMFLAMGVDNSGSRYVTLVSSLTSVIKAPCELAVPVPVSDLADEDILILTAAELVGTTVVDPLLPGQIFILHDAPRVLAQAIESKALSKSVQVVYTIDEADGQLIPESWIQLSPNLGSWDLGQLLPADAASFVSFSAEEAENQHTISSVLSPYCHKENTGTIFSRTGTVYGYKSLSILADLLKSNVERAQSQSREYVAETVSLESLARGDCPGGPLAVVDWTSSLTDIPARVSRFDTRPLFRGDRTYWICGLSGALGISLCDWMIGRGVKHLVLTSRSPRIDPAWVEDHKRNGANVEIFCCDVTNETALRAVHQRIVVSLPPVAGVLNGAMVLRDVSVRNMAFDQVTDVVGPKVLGSINLDRIFHKTELDFFILLSSINCIIGNVGQANYAAANMGMCGLAAHRRKRGLAATVINVGAVIGAGYITESDRQLDAVVAKMAMIHLSEDDFHQIFAEAIDAGHVDSPDGPEISTGLLDISADATNIPKWYSDPKFSRFIVHKSTGSGDQKRQTKAASIQERLSACHSEEDVLIVVKESLAAQLRTILQLSTADNDLMSMRSVDLGLDSLVSVDIRSWFLKNFEVSIPVLKIMANDVPMASLAELASEGIPAAMIPNVKQTRDIDESGSSSDDGPSTPGTEIVSTTSSSDTGVTTPITSTENKALLDQSPIRNGVDWEAEVQLPDPDRFSHMGVGGTPRVKPAVVVLTGSSGLLGHHLLSKLASEPSIVKIICLSVRRLSERLKSGQLPQPDGRIVYYEGDLRLPRLGLTAEKASEIFAEADAVIHNGSDTSHLKYYSAVRDCNVESTRELVRLCLPRRIALHYVSSVGVCLLAGRQTFPEVSATASGIKPPADGAHGYMCSKWVCETLLERVSAAHGLRISINRPSTIVREGSDATAAEAEFDWVNALLHYSHRIRAVPRAEHNHGAFDLVYVRTVCADVMQELFRSEHGNQLTYVNNVGDVVIPMSKLAEIGKTVPNGEVYRTLRFDQWADEAIKAGLQPAVAALIETFDEPNTVWPALARGKEA